MSYPFISVIIATYGRPSQLALCLQSLSQLDYPEDKFEIIVVDDGSPMPLDSALKALTSKAPLQLVRQTNAGAAAARNAGAEKARGEYLAITDDDCLPARDWLTQFARQIEATPDHGLGGLIVNSLESNAFSTTSQLLIDYLYDYYHPGKDGRFFASNNILVSAKQFKSIGGFDTRFPKAAAEDRDFCRRWQDAGFPLSYCGKAVVFHAHEMNLGSFLRQHFRYGRGAFHFHSIKSSGINTPIRLEPPKFYFELLAYPYKRKTKMNPHLLSALLWCSQAANASGFVFEKWKCRTPAPDTITMVLT